MNIDITNSNDSISNGEHDDLIMVTNSQEDELNRNKIKIYNAVSKANQSSKLG